MSTKELVETIYGKNYKYEIMRDSGVFSTSFMIYRDGNKHIGTYSSLAKAVEAAKREG